MYKKIPIPDVTRANINKLKVYLVSNTKRSNGRLIEETKESLFTQTLLSKNFKKRYMKVPEGKAANKIFKSLINVGRVKIPPILLSIK